MPAVVTRGAIARPADLPRLNAAWAQLCEDHSLRGLEWSAAAQELVDAWLRQAFDWAVAGRDANNSRSTGGDRSKATGALRALRSRRERTTLDTPAQGLALLAVGSLGRGDLAPGSDLDLLLVHDNRPDVGDVADRLWYPIWDDPMPLDHSVRTISQMGQAAESDLRVAQGLLDARPVAGDEELAERAVELGKRLWQKRVGNWLPAVLEARARSYDAHGDVAFLLEPDLKESRGGLRDLQVLALMAAVTPVVGAVVADERLGPAGDFLHSVRVELQRPDGRRGERLMLEDLERVARSLGIESREGLAHDVAEAGRTIAWLTNDAWHRVGSWLAGPRGRAGSADRALGHGLVLRDNEVVVPLTTTIADDPTLALRAAAASAEHDVPLSRATMARLAAEAPKPAEPWPQDETRALLALLSLGPSAIHAIETLDQLGIWERYMPEWPHVRNLPQFNPYHRWSVDRHLLETVANAAAHRREVHRPDLLLLGALLHDIGKGSGVDHSEAGEITAAAVARRLGLTAEDAKTLQKLVRYHLLLPEVATRRDLEDPVTVEGVAEAVGDETTLELLVALAAADGSATGPAAWTSWKERLVDDLAQRTSAVLAGRPMPPGPSFPSEHQRRLMATGDLQVLPDGQELVVVAPDRAGLFSDVAGALALHGIGVLGARAHSEGGTALEVLTLDLSEEADPRWERVTADIKGALEGRVNVGERLARRPPARLTRTKAPIAPHDVVVIVDNEAATSATVVEVRAPDGPGVLYKITAAIAAQGLDVVSARVATLAGGVVDTFYLQDGGAKLAAGGTVAALAGVIEGALEGEAPPRTRNKAET